MLQGVLGISLAVDWGCQSANVNNERGIHMHCISRKFKGLMWAVAFGAATQAQAVTVPFGSPVKLPGAYLTTRPELAGTVAAPDLTQSFSYNGLTGTVTSRVVREAVVGTLDFYWQVALTSTGGSVSSQQPPLDTVDSLRLFGNWSQGANPVDGDLRLDSGGAGSNVFAFATRLGSGDLKQVDVSLGVTTVGSSSKYFFLHTGATSFDESGSYIVRTGNFLDNPVGQSTGFSTYAPAAVPEPESWALAVVGLLALAVKVRSSKA